MPPCMSLSTFPAHASRHLTLRSPYACLCAFYSALALRRPLSILLCAFSTHASMHVTAYFPNLQPELRGRASRSILLFLKSCDFAACSCRQSRARRPRKYAKIHTGPQRAGWGTQNLRSGSRANCEDSHGTMARAIQRARYLQRAARARGRSRKQRQCFAPRARRSPRRAARAHGRHRKNHCFCAPRTRRPPQRVARADL